MADSTPAPSFAAQWAKGLPGLVAALVVFPILAYFTGIGKNVDARCTTNGLGAATCSFSNLGYLPSSTCASIRLVRKSDRSPIESQRVCSGFLMPRSQANVEAPIAFLVRPYEHCTEGRGGPTWVDLCDLTVEER